MTLASATFHRNIFVDNLQRIHDCAVLYFSWPLCSVILCSHLFGYHYAQNYAGIICQGLMILISNTIHK